MKKICGLPFCSAGCLTTYKSIFGRKLGTLLTKYGFERLLQNVKHKTISKMKGNSLIEFTFSGRKRVSTEKPGIATLRLRGSGLHLKWHDKLGAKETILPVPRTLRQFGDDRPPNINSASRSDARLWVDRRKQSQ